MMRDLNRYAVSLHFHVSADFTLHSKASTNFTVKFLNADFSAVSFMLSETGCRDLLCSRCFGKVYKLQVA